MDRAPTLLAELLASKRFPPSTQLTRLEHFLERGWWLCWRWAWIILAVTALVAGISLWFVGVNPTTKTAIAVLALADMVAWHASLVIVTIQMGAHVVVPRVRNAHEVHDFVHAQTVAARIARYSVAEVAQVEVWLKYRADLIMSRARFVLGGEIALGTLMAALQSPALHAYLEGGAKLLGPIFHVSTDQMVTGLLIGVVVVILQVLMVMAIASGYARLARFIELSKLIRSDLDAKSDGATSLGLIS
jgi:hypothetical protein